MDLQNRDTAGHPPTPDQLYATLHLVKYVLLRLSPVPVGVPPCPQSEAESPGKAQGLDRAWVTSHGVGWAT